MKFDILTLFPEMVENGLSYSIPGRAQKSKTIEITAHNLRDWAIDNRGTVDDAPYGGGPGMVLRVDVADAALKNIDPKHQALRIMLSPDGEKFDQRLAKKLAQKSQLVLLCGRYEGFDARIEQYVDMKVSLGDYVVSGGELPAMIMVDAITRLIPGALGNEESLKHETFENNSTDFPQYTRPETYDKQKVPEVLLSGHHAEIEAWRNEQKRTTN
ncbi:MAG: tRNA (guanosine(37)-N1)-methyltransferase TrmD [Patescibacteria group bacterium]